MRTGAALAVAGALGVIGACGDDEPASVTVASTAPVVTAAPTVAAVATVPPTVPATVAATPPPLDIGLVLEGSRWELDAIIESAAAEAVPEEVQEPTISFEGGLVTVDTGCNTGSAGFATAGDQITFEPLALTQVACDGVAGNVERSVVAVLQGSATVIIDNGILNIVRDGQQLVYLPN